MGCFNPKNLFPARLTAFCAAVFCVTVILAATAASALAWQTAHGNQDNSGAVDVPTVPAVKPLTNVGLGGMTPGAGPVIAPDGMVYVGNMRGTLMSFKPDSTPGWSRDIGGFQSIMSSPALGSDGSIYVVGFATVRDQTTRPPTIRHVAELHKFTAGGGWLWHRPIPGADYRDLLINAPPNILRAQGKDVIVLPTKSTFNAYLTAFSGDTGALLAHQRVSVSVPTVTGGASGEEIACLVLACFSNVAGPPPPQHRLPAQLKRPFPAVAIHTPQDGGAPLILMSDGLHDLIGLAFTGTGFEERFRVHDEKRVLTSTPHAWPDGHAMISAATAERSEVLYAGLGFSTIRAAGPRTYVAPTALGGSRHALVHSYGGVTIMSGVTMQTRVELPGQSIAAAAASRNHVFVSTASAFYTFDKGTLKQLAEFPWSGGGISRPVIGPLGHVYAIARDTMFVFPPPVPTLPDGRLPEGGPLPGRTR